MTEYYWKTLAKRIYEYQRENDFTNESPTIQFYTDVIRKSNDDAVYIIEFLLDMLDVARDDLNSTVAETDKEINRVLDSAIDYLKRQRR